MVIRLKEMHYTLCPTSTVLSAMVLCNSVYVCISTFSEDVALSVSVRVIMVVETAADVVFV